MTTSDKNFHYVYILESASDGKRYIGMTTDLRRRSLAKRLRDYVERRDPKLS